MKKFSFSKEERIKKKKDFEKIYKTPKALISPNQLIKANYFYEFSNSKGTIKIAAAVSSKSGKAVWRNRIKRLIREAYRLNKTQLLDFAEKKKINLMIIFSSYRLSEKRNTKIVYNQLSEEIKEILTKLGHELSEMP